MANLLKKLIFSDLDPRERLKQNVLQQQWDNLLQVWNNKDQHGNEISVAIATERMVQLFLIAAQFLTPSIYVRAFFGRFGVLWKHLGVELYVFFKLFFSYIILKERLYLTEHTLWGHNIVMLWCIWMIIEAILYISVLVFCSDMFAKPHSSKRNIIFILVDYITINFDFATIYILTKSIKSAAGIVYRPIEACYFSFVSSITIGYGDIVAANDTGKMVVMYHSVTFLILGVVFINFYISRIKER
jgi:hypothetical protein